MVFFSSQFMAPFLLSNWIANKRLSLFPLSLWNLQPKAMWLCFWTGKFHGFIKFCFIKTRHVARTGKCYLEPSCWYVSPAFLWKVAECFLSHLEAYRLQLVQSTLFATVMIWNSSLGSPHSPLPAGSVTYLQIQLYLLKKRLLAAEGKHLDAK